jgi:uncharacterized protein YacL
MKLPRWVRWPAAVLGALGGFVLGYAMATSSGVEPPGRSVILILTTVDGTIFAYLGAPYILGGWRNVNLRLATTPLPDLLTGLAGMIVGLVVAVLIGFFVREFPYGVALSAVLAALLAFLGASVGLTRRSELFALLGGPLPAGSDRRIKAALLDTSVIIDGRLLDIVKSGFVDFPLVVTRSVLKELQYVADSADPLRRSRGRRGLDVLTNLQEEPMARLEFIDDDLTGPLDVDGRLVTMAGKAGWAVMTTDFNLNRVARLEGVTVLNLNDLARALKPVAIPGEELTVTVVKAGTEAGQGVGYLDDGTMVVVENGRRHMNQTLTATVTSVLQTAAGRMIFAMPAGEELPARQRSRTAER